MHVFQWIFSICLIVLLGTSLGCQHAKSTAAPSTPTVASESSETTTSPDQAQQEITEETETAEVDPILNIPLAGPNTPSETTSSAAAARELPEDNSDAEQADGDPLLEAKAEDDTQEEYVPKKPNPKPGKAKAITFDDLKLKLPADTKFKRSILTDRVKAVDGERVSLKGFILALSVFQQKGIKQFVFALNPECKFGPGGEAFCVVLVNMKEGQTTNFTIRPITLEGILSVDPYNSRDGKATYAVYRMVGEKVKR